MSGAKNCPETPRQRMIGMMYLVLTAMLALNVSTDILNGFVLVDKSLHSTIDASEVRNKDLYEDFDYLYGQNPDKVKEWLDKAKVVQQKSDSLYDYIKGFKYDLAVLADGDKKVEKLNPKVDGEAIPEIYTIEANSNLDVAGQYGLNEGHGAELRSKIESYRDFLIELTEGDSAKQQSYMKIFAIEDGKNTSGEVIPWEMGMFEMMPVGAVLTILTKYQSDVRNAEGEMIQYLKGQTDASDFRVNRLEALVVPSSKYVIRGGKYSAQIVLSAVDSTKTPQYFIGDRELGRDGLYEVVCGSTGSFKYQGTLRLPRNDGSMMILPFTSDYSVGEPSVTISNVEMNVMYRGYDNKFSISVPGVANDKVKVNVNGAQAKTNGKGNWIIRPGDNAKVVTINVSAEIDGRTQSMGSSEYRVKPLPRPSAFLNCGENKSLSEGKVPRNAILSPNTFLEASYGPDGLLNINFKVSSFMLMTDNGTLDAKGNKFTKQQIQSIKDLKKGSLVNIVNIRATGPNGSEIKLAPIALMLN